jgi:heme/copper-type cytochrome/quinol oxidase subunit 2
LDNNLYTTKFLEKLVPITNPKNAQLISSDIKKDIPKTIAFSLLSILGTPTHHSKIVGFQIPATPIMEGIIDLHHDIMFFLTFIIIFVLYLLIISTILFSQDNNQNRYGYSGDNVTHNTPIEII